MQTGDTPSMLASQSAQAVRSSPTLELDTCDVDVWYELTDPLVCSPDDNGLASLSPDELDRYERIYSDRARQQFLAGRSLTRMALSRYARVPEHAWRFAANEHGRPTIDWPHNCRDIHFSLSHAFGLVVLAVSRVPEIGIDVEALDRNVDIHEIGESVLADTEALEIAHSAPDEARDRFFSYWTLKEAYMKARGMGFSLHPKSFSFVDLDGLISLRCSPQCDPAPERWQFSLSKPRPEFRMALAIGSRSMRTRHFDAVLARTLTSPHT